MIGIIGGGKWGQALSFSFSQKSKVIITSRNKKELKNFRSLKEVLKCKYLVFVIPAQYIKSWLKENFQYNNQKVLVASKGIDAKSGEFLNKIFLKYIPDFNLAFLSGPSFAKEVQCGLPTGIVISSINKDLANDWANLFPNFMKSYINNDIIGAEIAGAYKNVLAIAGGICDGLKLGNNAKASLISRGLVEMARFGEKFGAKFETFLGLSGAGDLFLTSSSTLSRNYRVGLGLSKNQKLDIILKDLGEVAEGVYTAKAIYTLSTKHNIYTPIADEVFNILNGKDVKDSLTDLLSAKEKKDI
jgi:glycerol-3-phosphate dehydrogenase (NAD(P)+)